MHVTVVDGLFYIPFPYQEDGGIRRNGVNTTGIDPRLQWRLFCSNLTMPSPPPRIARPDQIGQASAPSAWPSQPLAYLQALAVETKSSYCMMTPSTQQSMAASSYLHPPPHPGGSITPLSSLLPPLDQACHIYCLWTGSVHTPACPLGLTTPAHAPHHSMSSASQVIVATCQPPLSDLPRWYRLLATQMPMPLTPPVLVEATTYGCSRTSLGREPTCPLSLLCWGHASEVQSKMILMGHQISSCHVPVVRSFFHLSEDLVIILKSSIWSPS